MIYTRWYIPFKLEGYVSNKAKIIPNGRSQAVRLPKECRFSEDESEVYAKKIGNVVVLYPASDQWAALKESLALFSDDFCEGPRTQPPLTKREQL